MGLTLSLSLFAKAEIDQRSAFFERPVSCPLRFSSMAALRDQVSTLVQSLGNGCNEAGKQALGSLSSNVSNLEGIANSWSTYQEQEASESQMAKNLTQILGSLNIITDNTSCFYDVKNRGALPVVADVVTSITQLGLLVPSAPGITLAAGGYLAGTGLKIIDQLLKKKFNFNRPEERRAFLQLNCAFFDGRRMMDESGLFNPETPSFRTVLSMTMKKERLELIKQQRQEEQKIIMMEKQINNTTANLPIALKDNMDPVLLRELDDLIAALNSRAAEYPTKLKQAYAISSVASDVLMRLRKLIVVGPERPMLDILISNLSGMMRDLAPKARAWTCGIDDFEVRYRGPLIAFMWPVADYIRKSMKQIEAEMSLDQSIQADSIGKLRLSLRDSRVLNWVLIQRISSLHSKIASLEQPLDSDLFSNTDEGRSDAVEILEYYRTLQKSILGKEGKGYLSNSVGTALNMHEALEKQIDQYDHAKAGREKCSGAEKLRFAWAQFKFKVQESHDFVSTNMDLYRSSFKVGKERITNARQYVLDQIESVDMLQTGGVVEEETLGDLMVRVRKSVGPIETRLENSGCF